MQKAPSSAAASVCSGPARCPPQWLQQCVTISAARQQPLLLLLLDLSYLWEQYGNIIEQMVDNGAERPNRKEKKPVCDCVWVKKGGRVPTSHWILSSLSDGLCTVWCTLSVKHLLSKTSKKIMAVTVLTSLLPLVRCTLKGTKHVMWCVFSCRGTLVVFQSRSRAFSSVVVTMVSAHSCEEACLPGFGALGALVVPLIKCRIFATLPSFFLSFWTISSNYKRKKVIKSLANPGIVSQRIVTSSSCSVKKGAGKTNLNANIVPFLSSISPFSTFILNRCIFIFIRHEWHHNLRALGFIPSLHVSCVRLLIKTLSFQPRGWQGIHELSQVSVWWPTAAFVHQYLMSQLWEG